MSRIGIQSLNHGVDLMIAMGNATFALNDEAIAFSEPTDLVPGGLAVCGGNLVDMSDEDVTKVYDFFHKLKVDRVREKLDHPEILDEDTIEPYFIHGGVAIWQVFESYPEDAYSYLYTVNPDSMFDGAPEDEQGVFDIRDSEYFSENISAEEVIRLAIDNGEIEQYELNLAQS